MVNKTLRNSGIGLAALAGSYVAYETFPEVEVQTVEGSKFNAYLGGRPDFGHDKYAASKVNSTVYVSGYCRYTTGYLETKKYGEPVFSPYADSVDCWFKSSELPTIPVTGFDNSNTNKCVEGRDYSSQIVVSAGQSYGSCIDYYVPKPGGGEDQLSFILPVMADFVIQINTALENAGYAAFHTYRIKRVLSASSDVDEIRDGEWYGEHVDIERAIELALEESEAATSTAAWLNGAVYYPLLLEGD